MRYPSILLALLMALATPAFAAKDNPKEKTAQSAQSGKNKSAERKKEAAKAKKSDAADSRKGKSNVSSKEADASIRKSAANAKERGKKSPEPAVQANPKEAEAKQRSKAAADKKSSGKNAESSKAARRSTDTHPNVKAQQTEPAARTAADPDKKDKAGRKTSAQKNNPATLKEQNKKAQNTRGSQKETEQTGSKEKNRNTRKSAAEKSGDPPELRAAVSAATNDLEEKQALQRRTAAFLVRVNGSLKELQQARSNLSGINRQQRDAWNRLQKLDADLSALKAEVGNTRAQISRFVSGNYKNSQPNAVALFLKNAEPGQKTRFLRYTRYINSANEEVVKSLAKQQKELAAQERKINAELGRLKKLQANAQAALSKQGVRNTAEQVESRRQTARMAKEAQKSVNRKDNEQRLNNLISDLDKQKTEVRKKEAEARRKAAEARLAAAEKARQNKAAQEKATAERAALSTLTDEDLKLKAPQSSAYSPIVNANSFSRMQGRLKKPVNGMLSGLFGHRRENGDVWKGVFYGTPPAAVSSIAAGNVVYAAPLDGYGNVVVIDHGDRYVSVYSGLSEIDVAKGYSVGAGNKIGTSGALEDGQEGLYLEIRYNGQNMNPLSWIN